MRKDMVVASTINDDCGLRGGPPFEVWVLTH